MKAYINEKGVVLTGKAWEIRYMLKKYQKEHIYVKDWLEARNNNSRKNKTQSL